MQKSSLFEREDLAIREILDGIPQGTAGVGRVTHDLMVPAIFGNFDPPHLLRPFGSEGLDFPLLQKLFLDSFHLLIFEVILSGLSGT